MNKLLMSFAIIGMMAGAVFADDSTKPNLIFNPDTCMLRITPQDGQLLDDWFICVTDRRCIGTFHLSQCVECDQVLEITPHFSIDMTEYLDDCSEALPNVPLLFGMLKSCYK